MDKLEIKNMMNEQELTDYANLLAKNIKSPLCITLSGDLGAGKSTFARAFIRSLCKNPDLFVPSPTFSLIHTYQSALGFDIVHSDWYRLSHDEEVFELGIPFNEAVCLIEWPEKGKKHLPKNRLDLVFTWIDEKHREIKFIL
jgi:tRNA threonylcarbamoyl adenosine modification protein YjeE